MLPDYKVLVFYQNNSSSFKLWRKLSDLKQNDRIYCFSNIGDYYFDSHEMFKTIEYKGYISVYQFNEIEIKLPINRAIYKSKFIYSFYNNILKYQILLYFLSSSYKEYLLITEKIAIRLQKHLKNYYNFIYKNGKIYY